MTIRKIWYRKDVYKRQELAQARDVEQSLSTVTEFYRECGVGKLGLHKAFRIGREDETGIVQPITNIEHIYLSLIHI